MKNRSSELRDAQIAEDGAEIMVSSQGVLAGYDGELSRQLYSDLMQINSDALDESDRVLAVGFSDAVRAEMLEVIEEERLAGIAKLRDRVSSLRKKIG